MADDIFEEFVILSGKASQDILHRLEALLPIVDLWMEVGWERERREKRQVKDEGGKKEAIRGVWEKTVWGG